MANTIDPRFMNVVNWAAQSTALLAPYGTVPILLHPDKWKDWARIVIALPAVAALGAVRPEGFHRWEEWATQFNQTARLLT